MKQTLKKLCVSLLTLFAVTSNAQTTYCSTSPANCELVCNGGFETVTSYPISTGNDPIGTEYVPLATGWAVTAGSPDLFHILGGPNVKVPCNNFGYQNAHTGSAYIGMYGDGATSGHNLHGYTEGVGTNFSSNMIAGKIYEVSFWVSKADLSIANNKNLVVHFLDNISSGSLISTYTVSATQLNDVTNWQQISFSYCSFGYEGAISIYANDISAYTTATAYTTSGCTFTATIGDPYLYVDDISVKEAKFSILNSTTTCINNSTLFNINTLCGVNNANYGFIWNFGDGTSTSNTGTVTSASHVYTAFGTYTGTVTVNNTTTGVYNNILNAPASICSNQYTFSVNVPSISIAITTNTNTICNSVTNFTATPSPSGSYTYTWSVKDASTGLPITMPAGSTGTNSAIASINFAGIYQNVNVCATITNTLGCTATQCYYMPSCCSTPTTVVKYANYTFTANTTISTASVSFGGTVTVNSGVTLTLLNTRAQMDPNTKFVINGTGSMIVTNSYLYGCNALWNGIYLFSTSTVSITNSRVEDAKRMVIDTLGGANIILTNNYINKNYMGVAFKAAKTSTSVVTIKNNLFTCSSIAAPIGTAFVPTTPNLSNAPTLGANTTVYLLPPYNTYKSYTGLHFFQASKTGATNTAITIGGNTGEENVFDKMQWGAYSYLSRTAFQNNVFQNIKASIAPTGGINAAILALGPIFGGGPGPFYTQVGGASTSFKNTFTNNDYGVYNLSQSGLLITYNRFETQGTGITVTGNNNNSTVSTSQNKFINNTIGINYDQNTNIVATISENWFDNTTVQGTPATNFAIRCTEVVLATTANYTAFNNYINGYYNGIYTRFTYQPSIRDNEVHMRPDATGANFQFGITASATSSVDMYNNIIDMAAGTPSLWNQNGIFSEGNTTLKIHCNNISNVGVSILANGVNNNTPGDGFRGNSMVNATYGFWLNSSSEIGDQYYQPASTVYSADNTWSGCGNETFVNPGGNSLHARFFTRATYPYYIINASNALPSSPLIGTNNSTGYTGACYLGTSTPTLNLRVSGASAQAKLMQYADNIANGSFSLASPNLTHIARKQLYNHIGLQQIDPAVTPNINAFVSNSRNQPLGKFYVVDSLINTSDSSNLNVAGNINTAISATNDVDMTQQQFNNLYIAYLTNKRKTTVADVSALETIAYLCPNAFGHAVHQARGLLFNITHKQYTNVCEITKPSANRMAEQSSNGGALATHIILYPNPSTGKFVVETNDELTYVLEIYSMIGEKVCEKSITNKQEVDLQHLASGTYIAKVLTNGVVVKTERMSIIH